MSTHTSDNPPMGDGENVHLSSQNLHSGAEPHLQQSGEQVKQHADVDPLFERLRPQCEALMAMYEEKRSALLPMMHLFQDHQGYVSQDAMRFAAQLLDLSPAVVESTVSFYTLFFRKPVGKYMLQVCRGLMCELNGAEAIMKYFRDKLGIEHLETTDDGIFSYEEVECLAACDRATCMQVNLEFVYDLTPQMIDQMIDLMRAGTYAVKPMAQTLKPERTWKTLQDAQVGTGGKSPGTLNATRPNNAGGLGDPSGVIMLDRFVTKDRSFRDRSSERTVRDANAIADVMEEGSNGHAGH
jgi:NADH-quinone oxidoreductase subunit E